MNKATSLDQLDTLRVEHIFTLSFNEKWDKPLRRAIQSCVDTSFHFAESFRFIAMGISAYFVLVGTSKLIESCKSSSRSSSSSHKSKSSTKDDSSVKSKSSSKEKPKTSKPSSPKSDGKEDTQNATVGKGDTHTEMKE